MFDSGRYDAAFWAHVAAILVVLAGELAALISLGQARRARSSRGLAAHARRGAIAAWATAAACAVALVPALYMIPKKWSWRQGWVRASFVEGSLLVLLLLLVVGPELWRLAAAARRTQAESPPIALRRRATHPFVWGAAQLVTTLYTGNVLLMFTKPSTGKSVAIVLLAVLLGLLATVPALRRWRRLDAVPGG
jgi:hypothetical protein